MTRTDRLGAEFPDQREDGRHNVDRFTNISVDLPSLEGNELTAHGVELFAQLPALALQALRVEIFPRQCPPAIKGLADHGLEVPNVLEALHFPPRLSYLRIRSLL